MADARRSELAEHLTGCVEILRKRCPPLLPVRVELYCRSSKLFGTCHREGGRYTLRIAARIKDGPRTRYVTRSEVEDTIAHEWAHALAWGLGSNHGPHWGRAYARAYRALAAG